MARSGVKRKHHRTTARRQTSHDRSKPFRIIDILSPMNCRQDKFALLDAKLSESLRCPCSISVEQRSIIHDIANPAEAGLGQAFPL